MIIAFAYLLLLIWYSLILSFILGPDEPFFSKRTIAVFILVMTGITHAKLSSVGIL